MSYTGHVHNGVIVLDAGETLPEGTRVTVVPTAVDPSPLGPVQTGASDWQTAAQAAQQLRESGYDFDAWQRQRQYDSLCARDHLP